MIIKIAKMSVKTKVILIPTNSKRCIVPQVLRARLVLGCSEPTGLCQCVVRTREGLCVHFSVHAMHRILHCMHRRDRNVARVTWGKWKEVGLHY